MRLACPALIDEHKIVVIAKAAQVLPAHRTDRVRRGAARSPFEPEHRLACPPFERRQDDDVDGDLPSGGAPAIFEHVQGAATRFGQCVAVLQRDRRCRRRRPEGARRPEHRTESSDDNDEDDRPASSRHCRYTRTGRAHRVMMPRSLKEAPPAAFMFQSMTSCAACRSSITPDSAEAEPPSGRPIQRAHRAATNTASESCGARDRTAHRIQIASGRCHCAR